MPLIIVTGYPCSGKTYRSRQLASALEERIAETIETNTLPKSKLSVVHIPSYHSSTPRLSTNENSPNRNSIYNSAALEKTARAAELSAIKRALSKDVFVIADELNYIKGFRYQLWCEAKAAGTTCCTVHCAAREDEVEKWNRVRLKQWAGLKGEDFHAEEEQALATDERNGGNNKQLEMLLPESHTALYGDRILDVTSRSRSSSMDGNDGEISIRPSTFIEQSLKSLSLADQPPAPGGNTSLAETSEPDRLPSTDVAEPFASRASEFPLPTSPPYSSKTLKSLLMRYEPPSPFSKWDTPLFTIPASDSLPPVSAIWDALIPPQSAGTTRKGGTTELKAEVKPHAATVLPRATGADALQLLERVTGDVVAQIMALVKEHPDFADDGGNIDVKLADTRERLSIPSGTVLSLPMLQRLRRRFTQIQRGGIAHGQGYVKGEQAVGEAFVRFLNGEIGAS